MPSFDLAHSVALINLRTMEAEEVVFSTSLARKPHPYKNNPFVESNARDLLMELDSDEEDM